MGAVFFKPVVGNTTPRDGFEMDFPGAAFQMVPVGQGRNIAVVTDAKDWLLGTTTPGVLRLKDFSGAVIRSSTTHPGELVIPKGSFVTFTLHGESVGAAVLVIHDGKGTVGHSVRVSVKSRITKRVAVFMLRDIRRTTTRPKADAVGILGLVATLFLDQANIDLRRAAPVDMLVPKDLQDPLLLDQQMADIIKATPAAVADLFLYCAWNVEDSTKPGTTAAGLTGAGRSFVDDGRAFPSDGATQLFGHELGHGLGLHDREGGSEDKLMFRGVRGGLLLAADEINTINPSGRGP